jgi:hypothetical protein
VCLSIAGETASAATPVSYIDLSTSQEIMMVDGKPFLYTAAQISIFRLMDEHRFYVGPDRARVRCDCGYQRHDVGMPLLWKKIKTSPEVYDWRSIDVPIDRRTGAQPGRYSTGASANGASARHRTRCARSDGAPRSRRLAALDLLDGEARS